MDFEEIKETSTEVNIRKNRLTLLALFAIFVIPVLLAYLAFAFRWFDGAVINHGELIAQERIAHIEDYAIRNEKGEKIHGREFETLYWWILPLEQKTCDQNCQELNLYILNQTYKGLGKEQSRIKMLVINKDHAYRAPFGIATAWADFDARGMLPQSKTRSGKQITLQSNYIYLVDPLGNIFMRYPLARDKKEQVKTSKDLRFDILHLFKYSRLG